jgi:hypothetical protein
MIRIARTLFWRGKKPFMDLMSREVEAERKTE